MQNGCRDKTMESSCKRKKGSSILGLHTHCCPENSSQTMRSEVGYFKQDPIPVEEEKKPSYSTQYEICGVVSYLPLNTSI